MWYDVASVHDLPDDGVLGVALPDGARICLVRCGGVITGLRDECTHQAMPLSAGEVMPDGSIECPWHGARFDCRTGEVRRGPAEDDVAVYGVRVEGERVFVHAEAGAAT